MSKLDKYIIDSFNDVKDYDKDLPLDIHERTFVFRFGHYLANYIENDIDYEDYKVDIEYNRYYDNPKELNESKIFPDLIVHKRRTQDNLVAVEFKKVNNSLKDKERLIIMKKSANYLYENIYFIRINKNIIEKYIDNDWVKIFGDNYE